LAVIGFVVAVLGSVYFAFYLHYIVPDALTRVLNAYYVVFSDKFHLAAMGFVWNPLPSLIELPLVALHKWLPGLVTAGFAGNLMSSVSSAIAIFFMHRILRVLAVPKWWRISLSVVYMLNPLIWMYASNGMSESMMIATMLGALSGVVLYLDTGYNGHLIASGMWLAACFGARYEAVPYGIFLALAFTAAMYLNRYAWQRVQASLILAGFPLIFAGLIWVFLNWMIMGDPLYFLHSAYSNAAQIATGSYNTSVILRDQHHLLRSLLTVAHFTYLFPPVILGFFGVVAVFVWSSSHRATSGLLLAATLAVPLFQVIMIDKHASALWARFFITYVPTGILLLAFLAVVLTKRRKLLQHLTLSLTVMACLAGNWMTYVNMNTPLLGRGFSSEMYNITHAQPLTASTDTNSLGQGQLVAQYINAHPKMIVLLDTFDSFSVVPFVKNPRQLVISSDLDFQSVLLNPRGRVSDFLVPVPTGVGALDAINRAYPGFWDGKTSWSKERVKFAGNLQFKLFTIESKAP
jgi:hypothetical protein